MNNERHTWMNEEQRACYAMLCELMNGDHHVTEKVSVCSPSGIQINTIHSFATWDGSWLTNLVILAHKHLVRAEFGPGGPGRIKLMLHKRRSSGQYCERHPSCADLITTIERMVKDGS